MAINLNDRYPGETNRPDENYPYGSFRDRTTPTSKDGTKLQQDWANDMFSFQWRLLEEAGMTPDGTVDTVGKSQYFDALIEVIKQNSQNLTVSQEINGTSTTSVASENALGNVYRATVNKSGDTMTGDLSIRNNSPSLTLRNATIPANNRGAKVTLFNNVGRGTFSTSNEDGTNEIRHTLPVRGGELALGNTASGAQNGWLRDENTGIEFKWGEVNYDRYPGPEIAVTVTFPTPFETTCYNVQCTRKQSSAGGAGDGGVNLLSKTKYGFTVALEVYNHQYVSQLRGFSWFAIGK